MKMNPVYQKKYVIPFKKGISSKIQEFVAQKGMVLPKIAIDRLKLATKLKNSLIQNSLIQNSIIKNRMNKSFENPDSNYCFNSSSKRLKNEQMTNSFRKSDYSHKGIKKSIFDKNIKDSKSRFYTKLKYFQDKPAENSNGSGSIFKSMDSRFFVKQNKNSSVSINSDIKA